MNPAVIRYISFVDGDFVQQNENTVVMPSKGDEIVSEQPVVLPISTAKELIDFACAINRLHNEQQRDLVGAADDSSVAHCVFDGSVQVLGGPDYHIDAGGVVGKVQGRPTVVRCLNRGLVDAYDYDFDLSYIGVVGHIDGAILESVNRGSVSGGCKAAGGIAGWISMDYQGSAPLATLDCCLNLGDVSQSPKRPCGSCGGIVGEIHDEPPDTTLPLVRNCVCLGSPALRDPAAGPTPSSPTRTVRNLRTTALTNARPSRGSCPRSRWPRAVRPGPLKGCWRNCRNWTAAMPSASTGR